MMVVDRLDAACCAQAIRTEPIPESRSGLAFRTSWVLGRMAAIIGERPAAVKGFAVAASTGSGVWPIPNHRPARDRKPGAFLTGANVG